MDTEQARPKPSPKHYAGAIAITFLWYSAVWYAVMLVAWKWFGGKHPGIVGAVAAGVGWTLLIWGWFALHSRMRRT